MTTDAMISSRRSWRIATTLALGAAVCGMLLGGMSTWFLGSVALAGLSASAATFNFHIPAALIRLFAIGRTGARYGQRLVGHRAALMDQVARRVSLFASLAASQSVRQAGWQLGDPSRLADYLDDVEDLDFARLRASLPSLTLACAMIALFAATAFITPFALVPILASLVVILLAASQAVRPSAVNWERARIERREATRRLTADLASAVPLKAERRWQAELDVALRSFQLADEAFLRLRQTQAYLDMLGSAFGPIACLSVIVAAWAFQRPSETLLIPVFLAFACLTMGEAMTSASRILIANIRWRSAKNAVKARSGEAQVAGDQATPVPPKIYEVRHERLRRRAPDGRPIGRPITVEARSGHPTVLVGASGCGKTSLLKQIGGWIGDDVFISNAGEMSSAQRRAMTTLCLHDAAVLQDTVQANLFAGSQSDETLWRALAAVELDVRLRGAGGLDGWIRQDQLSLGEAQRLNLARAWLSERPIVLLDEPTEHLDEDQGCRILGRLLEHLKTKVIVIASHHGAGLALANVIRLDPAAG
jgi:ABC-type transport system involved in cytochrome bd biosynthesis fused ATPase/permease subunit